MNLEKNVVGGEEGAASQVEVKMNEVKEVVNYSK